MAFVSLLSQTIKAQQKIAEAAVEAAARFVVKEAKLNARGGFKTGRFVTTGWNTITYVMDVSPGEVKAHIGTNRDHFAYWELGHHNLFTGQYERKEWLRPALMNKRILQAQAAKRAAEATARKFHSRLIGV